MRATVQRIVHSTLPLALAVLAVVPFQADATSIIPQPWQAIVNRADLAGIVECEAAGELIARYRIIESWKGPPAGSLITIRGAGSASGATLPIVLCGERFIVAATRSRPDWRFWPSLTPGIGGGAPIWWRPDRADYFLDPLGVVSLPLAQYEWQREAPLAPLSSDHADLDSFRRDVLRFVAMAPEKREAAALRAAIAWYIEASTRYFSVEYDSVQVRMLVDRTKFASVDSIVSALLTFGGSPAGYYDSGTFTVLGVAGREGTLKALANPRLKKQTIRTSSLKSIAGSIRARLGIERYQSGPDPRAKPPKPPPDSLAQLRRVLASNTRDRNFARAFEVLCTYDPDTVSAFLIGRSIMESVRHTTDASYEYASYFAWRCGHDRLRFLRGLDRAQDPYVRVAGAVYLCFEREKEGIRKLEELSQLPGDWGVWAALTLARRGDKSMIPKTLEVLRHVRSEGIDGRHHVDWQRRLLVLLSNSAKASSLPQPGRCCRLMFEEAENPAAIWEYYRKWWNENESKITLHDPWLRDLERAKID